MRKTQRNQSKVNPEIYLWQVWMQKKKKKVGICGIWGYWWPLWAEVSKDLISVFSIKPLKTPLIIMGFMDLDSPESFHKWNSTPGSKVTGYPGMPHPKLAFHKLKNITWPQQGSCHIALDFLPGRHQIYFSLENIVVLCLLNKLFINIQNNGLKHMCSHIKERSWVRWQGHCVYHEREGLVTANIFLSLIWMPAYLPHLSWLPHS